jgi:hypothetical protein
VCISGGKKTQSKCEIEGDLFLLVHNAKAFQKQHAFPRYHNVDLHVHRCQRQDLRPLLVAQLLSNDSWGNVNTRR